MLGIKNLKYVYKISFLAGMNSRLVAKEHVATEFWSYYKERTIPFCVCIFYEESILFYPNCLYMVALNRNVNKDLTHLFSTIPKTTNLYLIKIVYFMENIARIVFIGIVSSIMFSHTIVSNINHKV